MNNKIKTFIFLIFSCVITVLSINHELKIQEKQETETVKVVIKEVGQPKEEYIDVWLNKSINIRKELNADSKIIEKYHWGKQLCVTYVNNYWAKEKETGYYINREFISEKPINYTDYDVPSNNGIKSYMDYRTITSKESNQYKLQNIAFTEDCGIRMVNDRYCIALGSYYTTTIGQYVDVELENGNVIYGILADCKANKHTDSTNRIHKEDSSVVEFVVDTNVLNSTVLKTGDVSYMNDWNSKVVNVRVYDKIEIF